MKKKRSALSGDGLKARAMRGSALTLVSFGGSNLMRLGGNLILTRILFPEAFGMMALVQVLMGGMQMFSEFGVNLSLMQSKRGEERDFINTAWTLQILRGLAVWAVACLLAIPVARFYGEPLLAWILPVVGLRSFIGSFTTTKVVMANRKLVLGKVTWGELGCQALGLSITIVLAWILQSVWAMVIAGLVATTFRVWLFHTIMPGQNNRFCWDRDAVREMFGFGKYIFLSTLAGYLINQSDRAILGAHISLAELGIYSVGMMLGTMPFLLSKVAANRVVMPLYRMRDPAESAANRRKMFKARRLVVASILALSAVLAFTGVPLIEFLYDPRYHMAGVMVVLFSLSMVPQVVLDGYTGALLSRGDSRNFFFLLALTATIQVAIMLWGVPRYGVIAAILAPGIAALLAYPLRIHIVRRHQAWDALGDFSFLALGLALNGLAVWLVWDEVLTLIPAAG